MNLSLFYIILTIVALGCIIGAFLLNFSENSLRYVLIIIGPLLFICAIFTKIAFIDNAHEDIAKSPYTATYQIIKKEPNGDFFYNTEDGKTHRDNISDVYVNSVNDRNYDLVLKGKLYWGFLESKEIIYSIGTAQ